MADAIPPIHPCPACGFLVFTLAFGSEETCPVCGWVDDFLQLAHPDFTLGANSGVSLREAQASALLAYPMTVKASGAFARDGRWRPLAVRETPRNAEAALASPVCYMDTPDPEEFEPYWLDPPSTEAD